MAPQITSRPAAPEDLPELVRLYRLLEAEMTALEDMWPLADALAEPIEASLRAHIDASGSRLLVGSIDGVPVGFLLGEIRPLLAHVDDRVGSIRLVFSELDARGVGVGEAMRNDVLAWFESHGIDRFDAHVLPGHRLAKNFFEAAGFSARHIVMHKGRR